MQPKVVVLYHRLPFEEALIADKFVQKPHGPNGVIFLLKQYFSLNSNTIWIATSEYSDHLAVPQREKMALPDLEGECHLRRVFLSKDEIHLFYHRTCKEGFWPILHSFPEKYDRGVIDWGNFEKISRRFANAACEEADDDSIVWIHDFNLWLVPYFIRQQNPRLKIAFFFHTPFPAPDIFNILPWRQPIVESLLSCDLVSFDIPRYSENFVRTANSLFDIRCARKERVDRRFSRCGLALSEPYVTKQLTYRDHIVRLEVFPEGTNHQLILRLLQKPSTIEKIAELSAVKKGCRLIFSPGRLDYVKGAVELLRGYAELLRSHEEVMGKVMLFLVAVPPRYEVLACVRLQRQLEELVAEINRSFATSDWQPVVYSSRSLSFEDMVAWFYNTDVLCIPSLRDGMNIICKEFIAVKGGAGGALVLSEFAGASVEFTEAVQTNPFSPGDLARSLFSALSMPEKLQQAQMKKMFAKMLLSDVTEWARQLNLLNITKMETRLLNGVV